MLYRTILATSNILGQQTKQIPRRCRPIARRTTRTVAPRATYATFAEPIDVEARILRIICQQLKIPEEQASPGAFFRTDFGASDNDLYGIYRSLENEFSITIHENTARQMKTVRDVIEYIKSPTKAADRWKAQTTRQTGIVLNVVDEPTLDSSNEYVNPLQSLGRRWADDKTRGPEGKAGVERRTTLDKSGDYENPLYGGKAAGQLYGK